MRFQSSLTVLTGASGSGKSMLLSALAAALGHPVHAEVVRGAAAHVQATFSLRGELLVRGGRHPCVTPPPLPADPGCVQASTQRRLQQMRLPELGPGGRLVLARQISAPSGRPRSTCARNYQAAHRQAAASCLRLGAACRCTVNGGRATVEGLKQLASPLCDLNVQGSSQQLRRAAG